MGTQHIAGVDIEVTELFESRKIISAERTTVELKYVVKLPGTSGSGPYLPNNFDHQYALEAVMAEAPTVFTPRLVPGDIPRTSIEITPINDVMWQGVVNYVGIPTSIGVSQFRFDTTGGTEHIVHDRNTVFSAKPAIQQPVGTTTPDYDAINYPPCNGLIGNTGDSVEGCDIVVPVFAFTEVHTKPIVWEIPIGGTTPAPFLVNEIYEWDLEDKTGSVNDKPFRGRQIGQVLFLGVVSEPIGNDQVQMTFKFASAPNRSNLKIGERSYMPPPGGGPPAPPGTTPIGEPAPMYNVPKKAWEVLSIRSTTTPTTGPGAPMATMSIAGVYVHEVYPYGDFDTLLIGS